MIKINNLTKCYKDLVAVSNLSLEIKDGEIFALLGLNGAGKSTTINIICSLIQKTSGSVIINGHNLDCDVNEIKRIVSLSPQETAVANNLTVEENLDLIATLYGVKDKLGAVEKSISEFGLTEKRKTRAKSLSGGQKRRLSIAMAMITNPKILILDEPTLGLDVVARKELWRIISSYKGKITVILTTHYLEEAEKLADRIAIMKRGSLVTCGTKDEILAFSCEESFENAFIKLAGEGNE